MVKPKQQFPVSPQDRLLIEQTALKLWPDADIQWIHAEEGLSIDTSAYPWNPLTCEQDAQQVVQALSERPEKLVLSIPQNRRIAVQLLIKEKETR